MNDLSNNLTSNAKLFADDTSLFSVVHDDLKQVNDWAFQWKMSFNTDPNKQVQELTFSRKSKRLTYPPLVFNDNNVSQTFSEKHVGIMLEFKLIFED